MYEKHINKSVKIEFTDDSVYFCESIAGKWTKVKMNSEEATLTIMYMISWYHGFDKEDRE